MLDLEHDALVRLVGAGQGLGHHAVEAGALELAEPAHRRIPVLRRRREVHRRRRLGQGGLKHRAPLLERQLRAVLGTEREQVERHERGGRLAGEQPHPAVGRVDPLEQGLEVELAVVGVRDNDLAIDHAAVRQVGPQGLDHFGEVPGHRALVPAADLHLVAVAEDDRPETVPLGLVAHRPGRDFLDGLGEHRRDRGHHRQIHRPIIADAAAPVRRSPDSHGVGQGLAEAAQKFAAEPREVAGDESWH